MISPYLKWSGDLDDYDEIYNELEDKSLLAFQELIQRNE